MVGIIVSTKPPLGIRLGETRGKDAVTVDGVRAKHPFLRLHKIPDEFEVITATIHIHEQPRVGCRYDIGTVAKQISIDFSGEGIGVAEGKSGKSLRRISYPIGSRQFAGPKMRNADDHRTGRGVGDPFKWKTNNCVTTQADFP